MERIISIPIEKVIDITLERYRDGEREKIKQRLIDQAENNNKTLPRSMPKSNYKYDYDSPELAWGQCRYQQHQELLKLLSEDNEFHLNDRIQITDIEAVTEIPLAAPNKSKVLRHQLAYRYLVSFIVQGPRNTPNRFGNFKFQISLTFLRERNDVMGEFIKGFPQLSRIQKGDEESGKNKKYGDVSVACRLNFHSQDFIYHNVFKNRCHYNTGEKFRTNTKNRIYLMETGMMAKVKVSQLDYSKNLDDQYELLWSTFVNGIHGTRKFPEDIVSLERLQDNKTSMIKLIMEVTDHYLQNPNWYQMSRANLPTETLQGYPSHTSHQFSPEQNEHHFPYSVLASSPNGLEPFTMAFPFYLRDDPQADEYYLFMQQNIAGISTIYFNTRRSIDWYALNFEKFVANLFPESNWQSRNLAYRGWDRRTAKKPRQGIYKGSEGQYQFNSKLFDREARETFKVDKPSKRIDEYKKWYWKVFDYWAMTNNIDMSKFMNVPSTRNPRTRNNPVQIVEDLGSSWNSCMKMIYEMQKVFKLPTNPEDFNKQNMTPYCPCFVKCMTDNEVAEIIHPDWSKAKRIECYNYNANCMLFYYHVEYARVIYLCLDALLRIYQPPYQDYNDYFFKEGENHLPSFDNPADGLVIMDESEYCHNSLLKNEPLFRIRNVERARPQPRWLKRPENFIKMYKALDKLYCFETKIINADDSPGSYFETHEYKAHCMFITEENRRKNKRVSCFCYRYQLYCFKTQLKEEEDDDDEDNDYENERKFRIKGELIRKALAKKYYYLKRDIPVPKELNTLTSHENYHKYVLGKYVPKKPKNSIAGIKNERTTCTAFDVILKNEHSNKRIPKHRNRTVLRK